MGGCCEIGGCDSSVGGVVERVEHTVNGDVSLQSGRAKQKCNSCNDAECAFSLLGWLEKFFSIVKKLLGVQMI